MCQCISGVAVLSGETVKVFTSTKSDSHNNIREVFGIRDDNSPFADRQTPVELIPTTSLTELKGMKFVFDDKRPDWWTDNMTDDATRQLFSALNNRWDGNVFSLDGDINLGRLKSISAGVTLSAGSDLNLYRLTNIPKGVIVKAKNIIYAS